MGWLRPSSWTLSGLALRRLPLESTDQSTHRPRSPAATRREWSRAPPRRCTSRRHSFGGSLPCALNFSNCRASQRDRRSRRMRVSNSAPVSCGGCCARHSAVSEPSTAAFSSDWRYWLSFFCAAVSSFTPASNSESNPSSRSITRRCSSIGATGIWKAASQPTCTRSCPALPDMSCRAVLLNSSCER